MINPYNFQTLVQSPSTQKYQTDPYYSPSRHTTTFPAMQLYQSPRAYQSPIQIQPISPKLNVPLSPLFNQTTAIVLPSPSNMPGKFPTNINMPQNVQTNKELEKLLKSPESKNETAPDQIERKKLLEVISKQSQALQKQKFLEKNSQVLLTQNKELSAIINTKNQEINALKQNLQENQSQEGMKDQNRELKQKNDELTNILKEQQKEISNWTQMYGELEKTVTNLVVPKENEATKEQMNSLFEENKRLNAWIKQGKTEENEKELQRLNGLLKEAYKIIEHMKGQEKSRLQNFEDLLKKTEIFAEIDQKKNNELALVKKQLSEKTAEIEENRKKYETAFIQNENLNRNAKASNDRIRELEGKERQYQEKINQYIEEFAKEKDEVSSLQAELEHFKFKYEEKH